MVKAEAGASFVAKNLAQRSLLVWLETQASAEATFRSPTQCHLVKRRKSHQSHLWPFVLVSMGARKCVVTPPSRGS